MFDGRKVRTPGTAEHVKLLAGKVDLASGETTMNSSTATPNFDEWQILFHETMAALLRAKAAVEKQFGLWGLLNASGDPVAT